MPRSLFSILPPQEGIVLSSLPHLPSSPVHTYVPAGYEPNYAYPLIVLFHSHDCDSEQFVQLAPRISKRNHLFISLQAPETPQLFADSARRWDRAEQDSQVWQYAQHAIEETCRKFHVHTERIYLAGMGEGASLAFRMGFRAPERFAGVISMNGSLPAQRPEASIEHWRVLFAHGAVNEEIPLEKARRDFLALYQEGVDVNLFAYAAGHAVHPKMLHDINAWVIRNLDADNSYDADLDFDIN